ncbi:DUF5476 domain-containing protein [Pseudomonas weihenstephanensis]|uniref:DUF5476 domain-containing protein n=1 Tax=Pseudomonas weihenstephanensis TaxID=1608994 RepID=UPI00193BB9D4|nr:DUF5476 domain-containing protein [Pseudomonas weihenstephanensis]MBM1189358.1 DUF5476 domain-containing protein [Pseudomonas weihenstephanensis]
MCFKSKVKTPKQDPNAIIAPAPVNLEEPKGIEFGSDVSKDDGGENDGIGSLKVEKGTKDSGDGSSTASVKAPASTSKKSNTAVKRALQRST